MELCVLQYFLAAARELYGAYPGIHYHIASGNAVFEMEQLDKGLIDFGIVFGSVDHAKYNSIEMPFKGRKIITGN